jgi:hypothetical protein
VRWYASAENMKNGRLKDVLIEGNEDEKTYSIIRFYRDENKEDEVIESGLTKQDAMDHCHQDHSTGDGWFDGWREE